MASEADLTRALINADKAGDVEGARILAAELKKVRGIGGQAPPAATPQSGGFWKTLDDIGRSVATGVPFIGPLADEFAAGMTTLTGVGKQPGGGETYTENVAAERARQAQIPMAVSLPGEITGAVAGTAAMAPYAAATTAGQAFGRLPAWLQATGLGGLFGAQAGFGHAEGGLGERAAGAGIGAPLGATLGLGMHGAVRGAEKAWRGVQALRDPATVARRKLAEAAAQDEITPARMAERLKTLGPQATIADVGGENVLGLARGAAGTPGVAKNRVSMVLEGRAAGEGERIGQSVRKGLAPQDYFAAEEQFLTKLKEGGAAGYKAAYEANPLVMTPRLTKLLGNPRIKDGIETAARIARDLRDSGEAKWLGPVDKELTEAARFAAEVGKSPFKVDRAGVSRGFSLETWHHIRQGLDALLKSERYTNPVTGRMTPEGRSISILRDALNKELVQATGGENSLFAAANRRYGSDIELVNALRDGKNFMKLAPEQITKELGELSDSGKEAYRSGAARAIMDIVENVPDQASAAGRLFNKSITRKKITAIFPDEGSAREFSRAMHAEQRFAKTKNYIGQGSRTTPMAAEIQELAQTAGNIGAVLGSQLPVGHQLVTSGVTRRIAQKLFPQSPELSKELAKILASRNQSTNQHILDEIARIRVQQPGRAIGLAELSLIATLADQEGRYVGWMFGRQNQTPYRP